MHSENPINCPLCKATAKSLWPEVKVCKCHSCGLMFRYPTLSQQDLQGLYQTSWADPIEEIDETGLTSSILAEIYVSELLKTLRKKDLKGMRILDYGAGRGAMLQSLVEIGADAYGVDPFGFEYLQQAGHKAFRSLDELPQGIVFDGVVSLDVVEHLANPWEDYKVIKDLLQENGWLFLSTPNAAGINAWFTQAKWREIPRRGHFFFFAPATLRLVLEKSGYKSIRRLDWFVDYQKGPLVKLFHLSLQFAGMDGELRYLALR